MKENIVAILQGKAKSSTKAFIALLIAFPSLMQIAAVKNFITPLLSAHPKIATAVGSAIALGTLLHNPQVQHIFGIQVPANSKITIDQPTTVAISDHKE